MSCSRPPPPADWNVIVDANSGAADRVLERDRRGQLGLDLRSRTRSRRPAPTPAFADGGDADTAELDRQPDHRFPADAPERIGQHAQGRLRRPHGARDRPGRHPPLRPGRRALGDPRLQLQAQRQPLRGGERLRRRSPAPRAMIQSLGFTDANNRSIPVDVHYYTADNSFYSDADHALHFGDGGVDDAEDADVVLHEYGHSIQDNQVPGFGPGRSSRARSVRASATSSPACTTSTTATRPTRRPAATASPSGTRPPTTTFTGANDGSGCLRWIDGTDEFDGSDIGAVLGHADRGPRRRALLVGGDDLHLRGHGRQRRGPQQRAQAGHRPQRDARPRLVATTPSRTRSRRCASADQNLFGGARRRPDQQLRARAPPDRARCPTDTTPPQVQAVVDPAAPDGDNGFYRGDVSVSWQVTEPEGSLTTSGCDPTTINADTPGHDAHLHRDQRRRRWRRSR